MDHVRDNALFSPTSPCLQGGIPTQVPSRFPTVASPIIAIAALPAQAVATAAPAVFAAFLSASRFRCCDSTNDAKRNAAGNCGTTTTAAATLREDDGFLNLGFTENIAGNGEATLGLGAQPVFRHFCCLGAECSKHECDGSRNRCEKFHKSRLLVATAEHLFDHPKNEDLPDLSQYAQSLRSKYSTE
jgi:hypothetical protein